MALSRRSFLPGLSVAVSSVILIHLARWTLWPILGDHMPFLTILPAIFLSAWYGGLRPGLLATGLGAIGTSYFLLAPHGNLLVENPWNLIGLGIFILLGVQMSWLCELLHRSRALLETQVRKRTAELASADEQLRVGEKRYRDIVELLPDTLFIQQEGKVVFVNSAGLKLLGASAAEQILGKPVLDIIHPDHHEIVLERMRRLREERVQVEPIEEKFIRLDGTVVDVEVSAAPLQLDGRQAAQVLVRDISDRKRAEELLRRSEARLQLQINRMPIGCIFWDPDFRALSWNPAAERIFGFTAGEVIGKTPYGLIVPEKDKPHVEKIWQRLLEGDSTAHSKNQNLTKDGRVIACDWFNTPLKEAGGRVTGVLSMVRDITETERIEEALRQSEAKYRSLVQKAVYGVYRSSIDGSFLDVNPALVEILGYDSTDEVLKLNLDADVYAYPEDRARLIEQHRDADRVDGFEVKWRRKDGSLITVRLSGRTVRDEPGNLAGFEIIVENVTERVSLENQLRQAQKMEAVGRLAGGIAHDFNNLLTAIIGYGDLVLSRVDMDDPVRADLYAIKQAGEKAATLTRQLLAFSRKQILEARVLDLNALVSGIEKILRRLIGEDVEIVTRLNPELGRIRCDPGQIEQIIMNLAVNARDAMPGGGKLTIETENVELDAEYERRHFDVKPGRYAMLAFSDTGCGMDADTQSHVFEPFFTTKEQGKGTGLGLSTVYGIVKQSGGDIWVYSEPGRGTTFKIYFPLSEGAEEPARPAPVQTERMMGSEVILLVEDAADLRDLASRILRDRGYCVLEAESAEQAVKVYLKHNGPIHMMISDVVMPGMSGPELAEHLEVLHPEMRVLFMSGYTNDAIVRHGVLESGCVFLQKPFTPVQLARKVREVLDSPRLSPAFMDSGISFTPEI